MLASLDKKEAKASRAGVPKRDAAAREVTTPEVNPLWQSLALTPLSIQPKLAVGQPDDPHEHEANAIADRVMSMPAPRLQRACACGGTCPKCDEEAKLQSKLAISAMGDRYEQEADRMANAVTSNHDSPTLTSQNENNIKLSRVEETNSEAGASALPIVHDVLNSSGESLDSATRAFMESRFGYNFGAVRVHRDARAAESARAVNSLAYTVGQDLVFGAGRYGPDTVVGRQLLAHELTHVVQQNGGGPQSTGRVARHVMRQPDAKTVTETKVLTQTTEDKKPAGSGSAQARQIHLPEEPSQQTARSTVERHNHVIPVSNDIQWYISGITADPALLIDLDTLERRQTFSEAQIAETSVAVLESWSTLSFRPGYREKLVQYISHWVRNSKIEYYYVEIYWTDFLYHFEQQSWVNYREQLLNAVGKSGNIAQALYGRVVAIGNFGTGDKSAAGKEAESATPGEPEPEKKQPQWTKDQKKELDDLIEDAKKQKPRPLDLPDKLVVWHNKKNDSWYMNVWVYFDTQGKQKTGQAIKLKFAEPLEDLLARVREASIEALEKAEAKEQKQREKETPAWAQKLKRELEKSLLKLHREDPDATDFPDGLALSDEPQGQNVIATEEFGAIPSMRQGQEEVPHVLLQIWVERTGVKTQRNSGAIPITAKTTVDQLVPYVRHLAAILRQYESAPTNLETTRWDESLKEQMLAPFPAMIVPRDLGEDQITVTGARNEFGMQLDYEGVYGGGELADMYIASKLYNQSIFFYWKIFEVPHELKPAEGEESVPEAWPHRWPWLYKTYNPGCCTGDELQPTINAGALSQPVNTVYDSSISEIQGIPVKRSGSKLRSDSRTRVQFSSKPGDYLVYCETRHSPIGPHDLIRASSVAYFPVRVKPIETVAKERVGLRTGAIATTESELRDIETMLVSADVSEEQRQMLRGLQKGKSAQLELLKFKEASSLAAGTAAEISRGADILNDITRLKDRLLGLVDRAKQENKAPSKLLEEEDPKLIPLYWSILQEGKSLEAYEDELRKKIELLKQVKARADEFSDEFKTNSPFMYSLEATFVSEVTGQISPLVLMLGEAPDSARPFKQGVSYSLVDVTSPQTQKVYRGYSVETGPEGHHEAIQRAFENFGEEATYGEGLVAVRIPPGSLDASNKEYHPGTEIKTFDSEEGLLDKVLKALAFIAAVAGVAALVATGIGAGVAAGILGAVAAGAGAITAAHNISERSRRHKLEFDAELVMDIVGIVGVIPLAAGARIASLERAVAGFQKFRVAKKFIEIYGYTEMGATLVLVPLKAKQDIDRIEESFAKGEINEKQRDVLIKEAKLGAMQGLMMLGTGAATARVGHRKARSGLDDVEITGMQRQAQLLELENVEMGTYKSLEDKGLMNKDGTLTEQALGLGTKSPAHVEGIPVPKESTGQVFTPKEKQNAASYVREHPDKIYEDADGLRHAPADEQGKHEMVEVRDKDAPGGIACELHSPSGTRVDCGPGLGPNRGSHEPKPTEERTKPITPEPATKPREEASTPATKPAEPTEPTKPTATEAPKPEAPTKPAEPAEATKPTGTEPTKPTAPEQVPKDVLEKEARLKAESAERIQTLEQEHAVNQTKIDRLNQRIRRQQQRSSELRLEAANAKQNNRPTDNGKVLMDRLTTPTEKQQIAQAKRDGWTEAKIQERVLNEKAKQIEAETRRLEVEAEAPTRRNTAIGLEINKLKGIISVPEKAGGSYYDVRKKAIGGEVNHMPAWTAYEDGKIALDHGEGPSIWMTEDDHALMTTTGRGKEAMERHQQQAELIAEGKFMEALDLDIREIRERFPDGRYEKGIRQMLLYVENLGTKLTPRVPVRQ